MNFIGRKEQLKKLDKVIHAEKMTFSLIYGRRRVGKSELVKQAISKSNVKALYYECKQVAQESNVDGLSEIVSEVMELPKLEIANIECQRK